MLPQAEFRKVMHADYRLFGYPRYEKSDLRVDARASKKVKKCKRTWIC